MVSLNDLKKILLLSTLEEPLLEKLAPLAQLRIFGEKVVLFDEGKDADTFYMLLNGKVLLEKAASEKVKISLEAVKPGYCFGWSALVTDSSYTSYAICAEPCELITIQGIDLRKMMAEDLPLGRRIMEETLRITMIRLQKRTEQFLKTLRQHPDMERLFSD
jgi:CRP/FNR family transcriptional regulator, cyclic AMP receptor protein